MIALLQRVTQAKVDVAGATIGAIDAGLMVLVCAERGDTEKEADALLNKLLGYRVFADEAGKMNRSVTDVAGGLLLVPQFTLAADTKSGTRPSFTPAAAPQGWVWLTGCGHGQSRTIVLNSHPPSCTSPCPCPCTFAAPAPRMSTPPLP